MSLREFFQDMGALPKTKNTTEGGEKPEPPSDLKGFFSGMLSDSPADGPQVGGDGGEELDVDIPPTLAPAIAETAGRLGIRPAHLAGAISFETGGSFASDTKNPNSSATGLIQFMSKTAQDLGTSTEELAAMKPVEQMRYVEKYLAPYKGKMNSLGDVYMAILYPKAVGQGGDFVLFDQASADKGQRQAFLVNRGLDVNRDGKITKDEAVAKVRNHLKTRGKT